MNGPVCVGRDPGEFSDIFKTNVVGPYLVTRALLPLIKKGRKKQVRKLVSPRMINNLLERACLPGSLTLGHSAVL